MLSVQSPSPNKPGPHDTSTRDLILRRVRDARFADGVRCPRCNSKRTARNGWFSGRQRYRCKGCKRTFSDLTNTPAANCKRLDRWPDNGKCMLRSMTVRATAREIGVNPSTAFRWRHKNLDGVRLHNERSVGGWLEFAELRMPYSEKGQRRLLRPARRHGDRTDHTVDIPERKVTVVAAADRRGAMELRTVLSPAPTFKQLSDTFDVATPRATAVLARTGPISIYARLAKAAHVPFLQVKIRGDAPLVHLDTARHHLASFHRWHLRFCGVATKYLDNYLAWYRMLDAVDEKQGLVHLTRWCLPRRPASPAMQRTGSADRLRAPKGQYAHRPVAPTWRHSNRPAASTHRHSDDPAASTQRSRGPNYT